MAAREWEWKEETQIRPAAPVFGSGRVTAMPYGESSGVSPSFDKVPTTPPRETTRTQLFEESATYITLSPAEEERARR